MVHNILIQIQKTIKDNQKDTGHDVLITDPYQEPKVTITLNCSSLSKAI
jgi:hypothetical protein